LIEIPKDRLTVGVVEAIAEEFIMREGTDYGSLELSLASKVAKVLGQIDNGDVVITFDPESESCTLLAKSKFQQIAAQ
jgi:uncharacterized protein YheU (UPF0270 family)